MVNVCRKRRAPTLMTSPPVNRQAIMTPWESKSDPIGALGQLARCGVALIQRSRIGPAGFRSFAGLEAPALVAGFDDVAVVGKAIE